MFTSPERLRLSHSQWRLLFKLTYGIYCTGGTFVSRPEAILEGSRLEINFQTSLEFSEYHQRALSWTPSHLIDFDVEIHSPHYILGKISANHTPTMTILEPDDERNSRPGIYVLRVEDM